MVQGDDGTTKTTLHFQWPITRTPKIFDPALNEWLDHLTSGGDPDTKLTVDEFKKQINQAHYRSEGWEARYYTLRSLVIILAAAVTALASASTGISGTAGLAIKIAAAVLSFFVAAITGILELLRASNRWALYRILRNNLFQAVWDLQQQTSTVADSQSKAHVLGQKLENAVTHFEQQYLQQVVISDRTPDSNGGHGHR